LQTTMAHRRIGVFANLRRQGPGSTRPLWQLIRVGGKAGGGSKGCAFGVFGSENQWLKEKKQDRAGAEYFLCAESLTVAYFLLEERRTLRRSFASAANSSRGEES